MAESLKPLPTDQTQVDTQSTQTSSVPDIEVGDIETYRYIPREEVARILSEEFKYGPSARRVDAIYVSPNGNTAVGVYEVPEDPDHFVGNPIYRGVEQAEVIAQTLLVQGVLNGRIPNGMSPRFASIESFKFRNPVVPGMTINTVTRMSEEGGLNGQGIIFNGNKIMSGGIIGGSLMPQELSKRTLDRARRQIAPPRYPIK